MASKLPTLAAAVAASGGAGVEGASAAAAAVTYGAAMPLVNSASVYGSAAQSGHAPGSAAASRQADEDAQHRLQRGSESGGESGSEGESEGEGEGEGEGVDNGAGVGELQGHPQTAEDDVGAPSRRARGGFEQKQVPSTVFGSATTGGGLADMLRSRDAAAKKS